VAQVIQQTLNMQVSLPVAQIVAGFSKVFVGEIVEKGACSGSYISGADPLHCSACGSGAAGGVGAVGTRSPPGGVSDVPTGNGACWSCASFEIQEIVCKVAVSVQCILGQVN
jgi:hypothetical protein